jgi:hypothetical protein
MEDFTMQINSNKGKGLLDEVADKPTPNNQDKIATEAAKMTAFADRAADEKAITRHMGKTIREPYFVRSYRMYQGNLQKMDALKAQIGSDFNFQINKALEYWFKNVHPEVIA